MFTASEKQEDVPVKHLPKGMRVYAIGDIHGALPLLAQLHEKIRDDLRTREGYDAVKLIYLGDYINRGSQSRETIDMLLANPIDNVDVFFLMGNHEFALIKFLSGEMEYGEWLRWGGDETLLSYGLDVISPFSEKEDIEALRKNFRQTIPLRHYYFLSQLKPYQEVGSYLFVHAGLRPGVALEQQQLQDLILIRKDFLKKPVTCGKTVIHGHTVFTTPHIRKKRRRIDSIGIDTGAFDKGKLTAIVLENENYRFISAQ